MSCTRHVSCTREKRTERASVLDLFRQDWFTCLLFTSETHEPHHPVVQRVIPKSSHFDGCSWVWFESRRRKKQNIYVLSCSAREREAAEPNEGWRAARVPNPKHDNNLKYVPGEGTG